MTRILTDIATAALMLFVWASALSFAAAILLFTIGAWALGVAQILGGLAAWIGRVA